MGCVVGILLALLALMGMNTVNLTQLALSNSKPDPLVTVGCNDFLADTGLITINAALLS